MCVCVCVCVRVCVCVCVSIYMYDCVLAVPEVVHTLSNSKHRTNYTPGRGKIVPRI